MAEDQKTEPKPRKLIVRIGIFLGCVVATWLFLALVGRLLLNYWKLDATFSVGTPFLVVLYFWGGFLLFKEKWLKALGVIFFLSAFLFNLLLVASPYNTQGEFKLTRTFILFGLAAGTFLICRRSIASRIFGILIIITTILAALMGSIFMSAKLHP